jgi:hypothetical protein
MAGRPTMKWPRVVVWAPEPQAQNPSGQQNFESDIKAIFNLLGSGEDSAAQPVAQDIRDNLDRYMQPGANMTKTAIFVDFEHLLELFE